MDGDGIARMHHKRVSWIGTIFQHRIEGCSFIENAGLSSRNDLPNRRTRSVGIGCVVHCKRTITEALCHQRVRIELQFKKRLAEYAFGIVDGAAKPEGRAHV